jgi:hypothetical protein
VVELPLDAASLTGGHLRLSSARWVLLDTTGSDPGSGRPYWRASDPERVLAILERQGFQVAYQAQGIYLLAPTDQG